MKAVSTVALLGCILLSSLFPPSSSAGSVDPADYRLAAPGAGNLLMSSGGGASAKAATDTFYIYGGPETLEGQFQTESNEGGGFGGSPDPQGWTGHDLTERIPRWHASTINAESTADGNPKGFTGGVGNYAAIARHEATLAEDYTGYGNNWDEWFVFTYDVSVGNPGFDPDTDSIPVRFTLEYKYYVEDNYDFLRFEWNNGGSYQLLAAATRTSYNDSTGYYEAVNFDSDSVGPVVYQPGNYIDGTSIQLRIRVTSDSGWSDEDGSFNTGGLGAAALDNIRVYVDGAVVSTADFEPLGSKADLPEGDFTGHDVGAGTGTGGWTPTPGNFVGDFSKLFAGFQDIDPCRSNESVHWSFLNDGTSPNNCPGCPIAPAVSPTWTYGIPGGYVVDYSGGLTNGVKSLHNEIWSPPIDWDLPGPEDDVANGGAVLGFTRWTHLPRFNSIFAVWSVRSFDGVEWTGWKNNNSAYYSNTPVWENLQIDVTEHLVPDPQRVQIALGVWDLADALGEPGLDATNAPLYDNVYFKKYAIGGPVISTRTIDLASDCFPVDGTLTGSCRFDANIDLNPDILVPGDSIVASIKAIIPGSQLADPLHGGELVVLHRANPDFSAQRSAALSQLGAIQVDTDPQTGWPVYYYHVLGQSVTNATGDLIADRFFWDLPDGTSNGLPHIQIEPALFFPGDVLHYHIQSADNLGNASTLPDDLSGFTDFTEGTAYSRVFTVRGLPSLHQGDQPDLLFWNDAGHGDAESDYLQAFREMGEIEGHTFDTYTTKDPTSGVGNGLGSAGFHGASAEQLAGYPYLVYASGSLGSSTISDGTGRNFNDLSDDLATMEAWTDADADRFHAYFGDDFAESMVDQGAACQSYLNHGLGVDFLEADVRPSIDNQTVAMIVPTGSGSEAFVSQFVAYGGCLVINDFDEIGAFGVGSVPAHGITQPFGTPYPTTVAGSVEWRRFDGNGNTKHTVVFPYDLGFVFPTYGGPPVGVSARAVLLQEVFDSWGRGIVIIDPGADDIPPRFGVAQNHPNPFNPRTTISFSLPVREQVSVKVYNVRGELVATLQDGVMDAGPQSVSWEGRDSNGREVSSGVYLYRVSTADQQIVKKMALLK